jgi:exodeoxyribonuclease VII large subunit
MERIRDLEQRLDDTAARLLRGVKLRIQRNSDKLAALAGQLEGLSPLNVLQRGYSLTRTADGVNLIRDAAEVKPGDRIVTRLAAGEVVSRVEQATTQARTPED